MFMQKSTQKQALYMGEIDSTVGRGWTKWVRTTKQGIMGYQQHPGIAAILLYFHEVQQ